VNKTATFCTFKSSILEISHKMTGKLHKELV